MKHRSFAPFTVSDLIFLTIAFIFTVVILLIGLYYLNLL